MMNETKRMAWIKNEEVQHVCQTGIRGKKAWVSCGGHRIIKGLKR